MAHSATIRLVTRAVFLTALVTLAARAQTPATWRLVPIAAIEGVSDADPFARIRNIVLHADGRLVVVDDKVKQVSMYDASGKSLGVIGRTGGGPGEYRDPYAAAWIADTLAIYDPGESRVILLENGKVPVRAQLISPRLTGGNQIRFYPVSRLKAYLMYSKRVENKAETAFIGFGGGSQDTILPPPQPRLVSVTICKVDNGIKPFGWPEAPRNFGFPVRPDGGVAMGNTGVFKIAIQSAGRLIATIERNDLVMSPIEDFYWEQENREYQQHIAKFGTAGCDVPPVRPPHHAPIRSIAVADNGDLWISVHAKDDLGYYVYSASGQFRAKVAMPTRAVADIPITIAGDRLAYVTEDEDGVQSVKTLRIVK